MDWDTSTLLVGLLVLLLSIYFLRKRQATSNLPPGPRGYPLYGNTLDLKKWDAQGPGILNKWAREFGDIYSIKLGIYPAVVLNTPEIIREVLVKCGEKTSGRASNVFFFNNVLKTTRGLVFNEGQSWRDIRRTAIHSLRDFGMGKKSLEQRIQEESRALIDHLNSMGDGPFNPRRALHNAFSNVIISIVFGERYEYGDEEFNSISDALVVVFGAGGFKNPEMFVPLLIPLLPLTNMRLWKFVKAHNQIHAVLRMKINQHREKFDPNDIRSFIDIYLNEEQKGGFADTSAKDDLFVTIFDLFVAGSETTTTTARWALLYLINNPEVQEKCQRLIKEEIGQEKIPSGSDREKLPYVEATINEILRMATTVPSSLLHRNDEPLEIGSYTIPKNTLIIPNLYYIHKLPSHWQDPERFDPERWIGPDGRLVKHEAFMPFGIGPRECIGRSLAMQEMFIFLVSLLQRFTFTATDPHNPPTYEGEVGVTHVPFDYDIILTKL